MKTKKIRHKWAGICQGLLIFAMAVLCAASKVQAGSAIATLEAWVYRQADDSLVGAYGPWLWEDQVWLFSGVPAGETLSLELIARDANELELYKGELDDLWIDPFFTPFGEGTVVLMVTDEGILVLVDPFIEAGLVELLPVDNAVELIVDIKPWSDENPFNVKSRGKLPVVVPGTESFDVTTIETSTVNLTGVTPDRVNVADVLGVVLDAEGSFVCTQSEPDGFEDLVLHFPSQDVAVLVDGFEDGTYVTLTLSAFLVDGREAEGSDNVRVIRRGRQ